MNNNIVNIVFNSISNNGGIVAMKNELVGAMKDTRSFSQALTKLGCHKVNSVTLLQRCSAGGNP